MKILQSVLKLLRMEDDQKKVKSHPMEQQSF